MDLIHATTLEEAVAARDAGYEPIECSFGRQSVLGPLKMDHHGPYENQLPVSLRAFGHATRPDFRSSGKYVVTGQPDADSIYALLALEKAIELFFPIARDIAQLDLDPVGIDQTREYFLRNPAFRMQFQPHCSLTSYLQAYEVGRRAFDRAPLPRETIERARFYEHTRAERAQKAVKDIQSGIAFVVSDEDSRDFWHKFTASLVVQYKPQQGVITFSGCSEEAVNLLAAQGCARDHVFSFLDGDGLHSFYTALNSLLGPGSGGRKTIGGSPRGIFFTELQARQAYNLLCATVHKKHSSVL